MKVRESDRLFIILAFTVVICLIGYLNYKALLWHSIKLVNDDISTFVDNAQKSVGDPITINSKPANYYYEFNDIAIQNIFSEWNTVESKEDYVILQKSENTAVVLSKEKTSYLEDFIELRDGDWLVDFEKYAEKHNIIDYYSLHVFFSEFEQRKVSIFTPLFTLKDYYFQSSIYSNLYSHFDEVREIKGDLKGAVVINEAQTKNGILKWIAYGIEIADDYYTISFFGDEFDLAYTLDIVSTIKSI